MTDVVEVISIDDDATEDNKNATEDPPPIMYTNKKQPQTYELTDLNPSCFDFNHFGRALSQKEQQDKKARAVNKILDAVLNPLSTKRQQLFTLREAMFHHKVQAFC